MLDGVSLVQLTPSALLGLGILFIMLGRLVPRWILKERDKQIDYWREAYETERNASRESDAQTTELLEISQTNHEILVAMALTADRIRESGAPNVAKEA